LTWRHLTEALGTPDYMSPEQIQGERGDPRSDLYSWGIMMYEFLTGRVPYEGDNWLAVMAGHLQRHPKPIHELRPDVPRELEAIVLTAMRRYPENRYQTAEEMLADLRAPDLQEAPAPAPAPAAPRPSSAPPPAQGPGHTDAVRPAVPAYGTTRRSGGPPRPASPLPQTPPASSGPGGWGPAGRAGAPAGPGGTAARGGARPTGASARDFSPEKPIGRLPAPASQKSFWIFVWLVAGGFVGIVALIIVLTKLLH
jgi:serine/threonine protein kinase